MNETLGLSLLIENTFPDQKLARGKKCKRGPSMSSDARLECVLLIIETHSKAPFCERGDFLTGLGRGPRSRPSGVARGRH